MTIYLIARLVCWLYGIPFPLEGTSPEGASYNSLIAIFSAITMPAEILGVTLWVRAWLRERKEGEADA